MFKLKKQKLIVSIFTVAFLFTTMSGTAFAKVTSSSHLDYVALGDSIPAGYGVDTGSDYPARIAAGLSNEGVLGNYNNYAVSGWTSQQVYNDLSSHTQSIRQAEIVTLTASGDDVLPLVQRYIGGDLSALTEIGIAVTDNGPIEQNITSIITEIKNVNKNADIYVMGYPSAIANNPYLTPDQRAQILWGIGQLNARISEAATSTGATYINTENIAATDLSDGIHPTDTGQSILATDFWNEINADFVKITAPLY